jgi:saccharopepsin
MDEDTGLLKISNDQYGNLQSLDFNVVNNTLVLIPNAQIWPRSLNTAIGGDSDSIYLIISDIGSDSGTGLDFINGYAFLFVFAVTSFGTWLTTCPTVNATTLSTTPQTNGSASHLLHIRMMPPPTRK